MTTPKNKPKDWRAIGASKVQYCWWFIRPECFTNTKWPTIHHAADTASLNCMHPSQRRKQSNVDEFMEGFIAEATRVAIERGWEVRS